jgi:nucleotide-binding universal stress UspA family protein
MFQRIVLAMDHSDTGREAIEFTVGLASLFGSSVRVINLVEHKRSAPGPTHEEETQAPQLSAALARLQQAGIEASGTTRLARHHQVGALLAAECKWWEADAIVLGLQREHAVGHRMMRGVHQQIERHVRLPVFVPPVVETVRPRTVATPPSPVTWLREPVRSPVSHGG